MPTPHKVLEARLHPNADRLRVYVMESVEFPHTQRQIVANLTNTYEVGDLVNVVLPGETYESQTLSEGVIRGVLSQGMAVGRVE
jgi:tRNA-binding EMAP/Myf-like protein